MLSDAQRDVLIRFAEALVDQRAARVIVPAQAAGPGYWFGGGNMVGRDGRLYVVGRYRNAGDSRTGLAAGERGLELAIFTSDDGGATWRKALRWSKGDLEARSAAGGERAVLSIEGSALHVGEQGVELFISTEKDGVGYPKRYASHLKRGTGVWSIDVLRAGSIDALADAPVEPLIASDDPRWLHVKDPYVWRRGGATVLGFCTHPYTWASSNGGYALRASGAVEFGRPVFEHFGRGAAWDVAITRPTAIVDVPRVGLFAETDAALLFYDGGECLRQLDEHAAAAKRPRGYSCEELGGLACVVDGNLHAIDRLSRHEPLLLSPYGTRCSRYVDVLVTADRWIATWQQAQVDGSQPLVMHAMSIDDATRWLSSV